MKKKTIITVLLALVAMKGKRTESLITSFGQFIRIIKTNDAHHSGNLHV